MSVPSPYSQTTSAASDNNVRCRVVSVQNNKNNEQPPKEDCRDYLRTGRCKYGASCKYHHPLNVQSGGGMKAPMNPSEPLFPIRYNEPQCQYYMKHGTCKFGQACKFHHPPEIAGTGTSNNTMNINVNMNGNNGVLGGMPVGGGGPKDTAGGSPHASSPMWRNGSESSVQMLPQRPDEPNCIFFLKNGRCKYGATCRYHHPLNNNINNNINNNRNRNGFNIDDGRSSNGVSNTHRQLPPKDHRNAAPKMHYVTALPPGSMQQGHFVVENGTVTFLSLDGSTPAHVVPLAHPMNMNMNMNMNPGMMEYANANANPGTGTIASSTSSTSIASSFETSVSNIDHIDGPSISGPLWNNRKASGNVGNTTYSLPGVVSTVSMQSDASVNGNLHYDSNTTGPQTWRGPRSSSFDHTRTARSSGLSFHGDELRRSVSVHSALATHSISELDERIGGRPRSLSTTSPMMHAGNQNRNHPRDNTIHSNSNSNGSNNGNGNATRAPVRPGDDDGLSMMTSALLTMLDTPTERTAAQQQYHEHQFPVVDQLFARSAPPLNRATGASSEDASRGYQNNINPSTTHYEQTQFVQGQKNNTTSIEYQTSTSTSTSDVSISMDAMAHDPLNFLDRQTRENRAIMHQTSRIQAWQGSATAGVIHENSQFSSIYPTQPLPSSSSDASTNIGLYY
mmetsp:Transcript_12008/g.23882  ORF Transcript_12008/g.23882 Transcript_12008/m.23882 type:complete len:677 (-) Transcript_12008:326-2356(-)